MPLQLSIINTSSTVTMSYSDNPRCGVIPNDGAVGIPGFDGGHVSNCDDNEAGV